MKAVECRKNSSPTWSRMSCWVTLRLLMCSTSLSFLKAMSRMVRWCFSLVLVAVKMLDRDDTVFGPWILCHALMALKLVSFAFALGVPEPCWDVLCDASLARDAPEPCREVLCDALLAKDAPEPCRDVLCDASLARDAPEPCCDVPSDVRFNWGGLKTEDIGGTTTGAIIFLSFTFVWSIGAPTVDVSAVWEPCLHRVPWDWSEVCNNAAVTFVSALIPDVFFSPLETWGSWISVKPPGRASEGLVWEGFWLSLCTCESGPSTFAISVGGQILKEKIPIPGRLRTAVEPWEMHMVLLPESENGLTTEVEESGVSVSPSWQAEEGDASFSGQGLEGVGKSLSAPVQKTKNKKIWHRIQCVTQYRQYHTKLLVYIAFHDCQNPCTGIVQNHWKSSPASVSLH